MNQYKLIDTATITILAGNGGDGRVSFRREKYIPKGGPDGGDGGKGGDVYFEAASNMATLMDFRSKPKYAAEEGERGGQKHMKGASADDLIIRVPLGTLIYDITDGENTLIGDLVNPGDKLLAARGGKGGKGNDRFKSSTNRTPMQFTRGGEGERKDIRLEVKLIADVGLIGLPNAGKSTLINQLTNANAKVDSYPFTTITPNLGVTKLRDGNSVIIADIPGLIEGASTGKGLGDDFLRHVERTRILVHLIDAYFEDSESPEDTVAKVKSAYKSIRKELKEYGAGLSNKKEIVVINKLDITEVSEAFENIVESFKTDKIEVIGISAVTGEGIEALKDSIQQVLASTPRPVFEVGKVKKVFKLGDLPNKRIVFKGVEEETVENADM